MSKNNLYVKNLGNLDDDDLWCLFNEFGKIISHKISRNSSGQSKGFGFVCFQHEKDAKTAISKLNGQFIGSKPLYVSYFQGKEERENLTNEDYVLQNKNTSKKIAVSNLDENIDDEKLRYLFARFGNITSSNVKRSENGLKSGIVSFEKNEEAETASEIMNGFMLCKKKLCVKLLECNRTTERISQIKSVSSTNLPSLLAQPCKNKVFVTNLDERINSKELRAFFKECGTITSCSVLEENGKSRGCGIVAFSSEDEAEIAILFMNGCKMRSKQLSVDYYKDKVEQKNDLSKKNPFGSQLNLESQLLSSSKTQSLGSKIFVKCLHEDVNDSDLNHLFARFGSITSCYVLRDKNRRSKGSGVVKFSTEQEATDAIRKMNGTMFMTKTLCVEFFKCKKESVPELRIKKKIFFIFLINLCSLPNLPIINLCSLPKFEASSSIKSASLLDLSTRSAQSSTITPRSTKDSVKNDLKNCNLRIENLDDDVDDNGLYRLFSCFGKIKSAKVMTYNNGKSKGYGYVCYETNEEASKAISSMNGVQLSSKETLVITYYEQRKNFNNVDGNKNEVEKECCICYSILTTRIVFDPCGHSCVCDSCVTQIDDKCPLCRGNIIKYIKAYI
ncbi:uncharacterized protein LOC100210188 isoform X2 [Hydra vulgaris]|uniref:uncharacterized protein LOC100210188 isoform X2 n=1 Tax=Hydra vulgaris TaxID=6087 RepID=UPI001F5F8238|nr:polyadenylate-binding protein 1 isoform X2 [Hydra vulgaris]